LAEGPHFARFDVRQRGRKAAEIEIDLTRHEVGHRWPAAFVRHMHDVDVAQ